MSPVNTRRRADRAAARGAKAALTAAGVLLVLALLMAPTAAAVTVTPALTIATPANGSSTNNVVPLFSGTTSDFDENNDWFDPLTLRIYRGAIVQEDQLVQTVEAPKFAGPAWAATPTEPLTPGIYTAVAEQTHELKLVPPSEPVTFTVDTTPPQLTLALPASESSSTGTSQLVAGSSGTAAGDLQTVTIQLFSGLGTEPAAFVESLVVQASNGNWAGTLGGLSPGTYSVLAEQSDQAGNIARTASVSFTLNAQASAPAHPPPTASFKWFPAMPRTGQGVSLVSSSNDPVSPIVSFAWAPGGGAFHPGGPSATTSFATPGDHVVRLRVTAADGLSSVATQTIHVTGPPLTLMQPFPIVRVAGSQTASGVNLSLLTVQAPRGARVTVSCTGKGCPARSQSRIASASRKRARQSTVELAFARFQRPLRAGVVLEVRVSKPGTVGKYTRFAIRRAKVPLRVDACVASTDPTPIRCPS